MLCELPCIHSVIYSVSNRARYFFSLQTIKQRKETMEFYTIIIIMYKSIFYKSDECYAST